ncbi:MAG: SDR family oxidoreductase [Ruminococcus sp.]|nr:SDR family oxidoreductase [Ruminococcus sp.]
MRTALVTGGSGDIGAAVCRRLASEGFAVAIGYNKNEASASSLCAELRERGCTAMIVRLDLSDPASAEEGYGRVKSELGAPEVLVNNGGRAHIGLFTDMTDSEIDDLIRTDLTGAMQLSRRAAADMVKRGSGRIVSITSVWGEAGASCETVYSAAKAGLIGFTRALGKELAPGGITVNCISAGMIDTKMNAALSDEDKAAIVDDIPMGRMGTPDEIASLVSFLCSEGAAYITAQCIRVDGGWM